MWLEQTHHGRPVLCLQGVLDHVVKAAISFVPVTCPPEESDASLRCGAWYREWVRPVRLVYHSLPRTPNAHPHCTAGAEVYWQGGRSPYLVPRVLGRYLGLNRVGFAVLVQAQRQDVANNAESEIA
jgi:hypothetical protein